MLGKPKKTNQSLSQDRYAHAASLVTKVVEPKIHKLIQELNIVLAKHGTLAGCEIQWFFDKLPETSGTTQGDYDDED